MTTFIILKVLSGFIFPPASLAIGVLLWGALRLFGRRRLATAVLSLAIAETVIMSLPPTGDLLMRPLERQARAAARNSPRCCFDAIVILGGGIAAPSVPGGRPQLTEASDRLWEGARLWQAKVAPKIIVSGGSVRHELGLSRQTEASAMRVFLIDLGVPTEAIISEDHSLNTIENMHYVHRIVGDGSVALVTTAHHMPRALKIAAREGLKVSAFPANFRSGSPGFAVLDDWLPTPGDLDTSTLALREWIALAFDWRGPDTAR